MQLSREIQNTPDDEMGLAYRTKDGKSLMDTLTDVWILSAIEKVTEAHKIPDLDRKINELSLLVRDRDVRLAMYEETPGLRELWKVLRLVVKRAFLWIGRKLSGK